MRFLAAAAVFALCAAALASKQSSDGDFLFEEDDWKQKKEKPAVKTWIWDPESGLCSALECRHTEMCLLEDSFTAVCVSRTELKTNGDWIVSRQLAEEEHLVSPEPWSDLDDDPDDYSDDDDDDDDDDDEIDLDDSGEGEDEYDYDEEDEEEGDDEDLAGKQEAKKDRACRECPYTQPSVSSYICGTDNRTYSSLCRLEQHNCVHGSLVTADCRGFCPCSDPGSYRRRQQKLRSSAVPMKTKTLKKSAKSKLKSKYDKYHQEMKKYNNVKYYPKHSGKPHKHQPKCTKEELESMGARLRDWFAVLKSSDAAGKHSAKHHKHYDLRAASSCRPTERWMFAYLDRDADGQLTRAELYAVERDQYERCLTPFLDTCDLDGDMLLSGREWCRCFLPVSTPCKERRAASTTARLGGYRPACDEDGFYLPTQCGAGQCWCVDRYGTELRGSRAGRGHTRCHGSRRPAAEDFNAADEDDEDNYVLEGSGAGGPLEF